MTADVHQITVDTLQGGTQRLDAYEGKVMLIVNTASQCGFTPQYAELENLWRTYRDQGLVVLGFPCNQFGGQEPGDAQEIGVFCEKNYGVSFPMFGKVEVNGESAHPLFRLLKQQAPGVLGTEAIKWNFTKFLVDRQGKVVARHAPATRPSEIVGDIEQLLGRH